MPSTASTVGRLQHKHEREGDELEQQMAHEETSMRAALDCKHNDAKEAALKANATPPRSGGRPSIHMPSDDGHIDRRIVEISKLRDKHDDMRKAMRDRHRRELEAARSKGPTTGMHVPQMAPESHQGSAYVIWKDLDSARQQAMRGVFQSTAKLRDAADADVLDLTKSTAGNRYMQAGARMASASNERHEKAHLDLSRKEQQQLDSLASRFESEIEADRRRIHSQAVERAALDQRHMDESRRATR